MFLAVLRGICVLWGAQNCTEIFQTEAIDIVQRDLINFQPLGMRTPRGRSGWTVLDFQCKRVMQTQKGTGQGGKGDVQVAISNRQNRALGI